MVLDAEVELRHGVGQARRAEVVAGEQGEGEVDLGHGGPLATRNVEEGTGGPFAAVVVDDASGEVLSIGTDLVLDSNVSSMHAEVVTLGLATAPDVSGPGRGSTLGTCPTRPA